MTVTPDAKGHYLRELLGKPFTDEQLDVITAGLTPQLVVAGAGSGKTTVMAARVVHVVAFHGIAPASVLGLTFTNKAAGQLSASVRSALRKLRTHDLVDDAPTVATYHSYAAGIVRDHALRIGREPMTTLLTEAGRWQLAMRVVRNASGPFHHLTWQPAYMANSLLALDGEMAEHLTTPDAVRAFDARLVAEATAAPKQTQKVAACAEAARARDELLGLVEAYRAEKQRLDLIDYGDQVALAAEIARASAEVRAVERDRFAVVLLDEYQDTGVGQRKLLAALFGADHAVTAVGDPNQAIYGWRGASVGNLLRFREHFGGTGPALPLMTSFRCGGRILDAANALAAPLLTSPGAARRPRVEVPPLAAMTGCEDAGEIRVALLERVDHEAEWVADQIAAAVTGEDIAPGKVAVLCRRRVDFPLLHRALVERDVPVEVVGLGGLLEMPEVADLVAVLRVLVEPTANAALLRVLTGPRWRIGPRDLAALGRRAARLAAVERVEASDDDVLAALRKATESVDAVEVAALLDAIDTLTPDTDDLSADAVARLLELRAELTELRAALGQPIVEIATEVVRRTGLDVELETETARVAAARVANLAAFLDHAAQFTGLEGESDLASFLAWLDAAVAAEAGLDVGGVSDADTVKLLTVHKAKGLEWDVVAVPGLTDKVFPSDRGRSRWTSNAAVLPFPCRGDEADLPRLTDLSAKGLDAFKSACADDDADEERRLGYVAATRARHRLLTSGYWWGATRQAPTGPSTLLLELHALAADGLVEVDEWAPEPEDAANPVAADAVGDVAWPPSYDQAALTRRQVAAAMVHDAIGGRVTEPPFEALTGPERAAVARWDEEVRLLLDELRSQRNAVREVPLPRCLTASQVVALAHDPDELAMMLARPMPVRPQPQARRGSRFHKWVEDLYGAVPLLDPDDLPGAGDADVTDAELAMLQEKFLADGWGERRPVAVEQPFELVIAGRLVRGRIDAVYPRADGGYDVIDYKTGEVPKDFAAAALQLSVYRLAWADLRGVEPEDVDAGFLYVRTGTVKRPERLLSRPELAALFAGGG